MVRGLPCLLSNATTDETLHLGCSEIPRNREDLFIKHVIKHTQAKRVAAAAWSARFSTLRTPVRVPAVRLTALSRKSSLRC